MELRVHQDMKIVEIWLTKTDRENGELQKRLHQMYQDYTAKSFKVTQFHSGADDLYAATRDLLLFNRKRIPYWCDNCGHAGPYDDRCPKCGSSLKRFNVSQN